MHLSIPKRKNGKKLSHLAGPEQEIEAKLIAADSKGGAIKTVKWPKQQSKQVFCILKQPFISVRRRRKGINNPTTA